MNKKLKLLFLIVPSVILSSCSNQSFPYEGNTITLEKPLSIEIFKNGQGVVWLKGDDLNSFYDKYFKETIFLETESIIYGSCYVGFGYDDDTPDITVGSTDYGLLCIHDIPNKKFYAGVEPIDYTSFEKDVDYYFEKYSNNLI